MLATARNEQRVSNMFDPYFFKTLVFARRGVG